MKTDSQKNKPSQEDIQWFQQFYRVEAFVVLGIIVAIAAIAYFSK